MRECVEGAKREMGGGGVSNKIKFFIYEGNR